MFASEITSLSDHELAAAVNELESNTDTMYANMLKLAEYLVEIMDRMVAEGIEIEEYELGIPPALSRQIDEWLERHA